MNTLKPCPFCGGAAKVIQREHPAITHVVLAWIVQCQGCTAETCSEHYQWAIDYWNRRSPSVPISELEWLADEWHKMAYTQPHGPLDKGRVTCAAELRSLISKHNPKSQDKA